MKTSRFWRKLENNINLMHFKNILKQARQKTLSKIQIIFFIAQ